MSPTKESTKEPKTGKPRVYALAAEMNLDTKAVLELCQELGFSAITSQLKALEPEQVEAIRARVKKGAPKPAPAAAPVTPVKPTLPAKIETKIPTIAKPKAAPKPAPEPDAGPTVEPVTEAPAKPVKKPTAETPVAPVAEPVPEPVAPPVAAEPAPASVAPKRPPTPAGRPQNLNAPRNLNTPRTAAPKPAEPAPVETPPADVVAVTPPAAPAPVPVEAPPTVVASPPPPAAVPPTPAPVAPPRPAVSAPAATATPNVAPGATRPPMPGNAPPRPVSNAPPQMQGRGMPTLGGPRPNPMGPSAGGPPPRVVPVSTTGRPAPNPGPPTRPVAPPRTGMNQSGPPGSGPRPSGAGISGTMMGGRAPAGASAPPAVGPANPSKSVKLTGDQITRLRVLEQQRVKVTVGDIINKPTTLDKQPAVAAPVSPGMPGRPGMPARPGFPPPMPAGDGGGGGDGDDRKKGGPGAAVPGRDQRHKSRVDKGRNDQRPGTDTRSIIIGPGGRVDTIDRFRHIKKHRGKSHVKQPLVIAGGKVEIAVPITIRTLSEAIGMKVTELLLKLKAQTGALYSITSAVEFENAELIAIDRKIELVAKKQESAEEETLRKIREVAEASDTANTALRPPIVTIMGHVDHGKTSLLDRIRQEYGLASDVVSTETGGITQVLRAWRVEKDAKSTTFLDTPGHEAFTKMRARGANVTDIAVIVVSAADGIMPQTQEAVAHAKAAGVDIIVAINKVDLPGAQPDKVKNRLYDLELVPEDMGGDVPVIYTSAVTGQGVAELLDSIALLAEIAELKADATLPGSGTCLEAYKEEGRGVVATLLVQNGTLRKGDTVLCGGTYGRVRAMYDDLGRTLTEAGPSTPVKFTGLDDVPDADDPFYVVADVATAREIAGKRRDRRSELDRHKFQTTSLDKLREQNSKAKITELKVILKAEARGSVEAIKKELEKLVHEEVAVRLLHAGIGAITESDVQLALTSPADTLIVGFNVTSDDAAMRMAENRDLNIREYQIIYNLVDDVKAALEGRLKPTEEVVHLGRAVVRETFKISKTGTIAGCYVTSGAIERSARIRIIRDGTVLFPIGEKVAGLDSLKRFKDDVREVREGFECGLKMTGFDDIKVGDVIEAFKIEIKMRTL